MKRLVFFFVLLLILTTPFLFLEFALRYVGLGEPLVYDIDYAYRYALAPDQRVERRRGAVVTVNESGLRALEPWEDGASPKVLFIGDSVTYGGSYIDDSDLFSEVFCQQWEQRTGNPVTCGNAGVNSYGVLNMSMRLRHDPRVQDANVIIIVILPGDAVRGLVDGSMHHYFTKSPDHFFRATHEMAAFLSSRTILRLAKKIDYTPSGRLAATEYALDHLKETVLAKRKQGAEVFIAVSPPNNDLRLEAEDARPFLDAMAQRFPEYIQLGSALEGITDAFYDGVHFEVNGHHAVGQFLANKITLSEPTAGQ